jgi:uncharacterized protein YjiS (DUF1127 family)
VNLSEDSWLVSSNQQQVSRALNVWLSRLHAGLDRISAFWAARRERAQQSEVLFRFSDRELWDLGLSRSDIPGILNGSYRRD